MDKLKGVTEEKGRLRRKFKAVIRINGKLKHLGYYPTAEDAHKAYMAAFNELTTAKLTNSVSGQ